LAQLRDRLGGLAEQPVDRPEVLARLGGEPLHVVAQRGQARRDRRTALGVLLLPGGALGRRGLAPGLLLGALAVALLAPGPGLGLAGQPVGVGGGQRGGRGGALGHGAGLGGGRGGALGRGAVLLGLGLALDHAQLVGGARLLIVDLLAAPEPLGRLAEPVVAVVAAEPRP